MMWMFLRRYSEEFGHVIEEISPEALRLLEDYSWPGNIREMRNVLTNIAIFEEEPVVTEAMVHRYISADAISDRSCVDPDADAADDNIDTVLPLDREFILPEEPFDLEEFNRRIVTATLRRFEGNRSRAARHLGLTRNQLYGRYRDLS